MNAHGSDVLVSDQLTRSKQEGQELVVVQTPNTVRASWFEIVCLLYGSHESEVAWKNEEREGGKCAGGQDARLAEAKQPEEEVQFMTGSIVNT